MEQLLLILIFLLIKITFNPKLPKIQFIEIMQKFLVPTVQKKDNEIYLKII